MGRRPTPLIPLNPLILRYLEDIEAEQQSRLDNKTVEPFEMLLIPTLLEGEPYPDGHEQALLAFKRYFSKEKVLDFPTLLTFANKYKFNWTDSDVMDWVQIDRHHSVSFVKFFPVKVLNLKKLKDFRKKYTQGNTAHKVIEIPTATTTYNQKTRTLSKEGVRPYSFQGRNNNESQRIFFELWENRRHTVGGKVIRQGKEDNFNNFAMKARIATDRDVLRVEKNQKRLEQRVRNVVKSLTRDTRFPLRLTCGKSRVLLTVKD